MIETIMINAGSYIEIMAYIISAAALIDAMTPNTTDDVWVAKIRKFVDVLALNVGNAKNDKQGK